MVCNTYCVWFNKLDLVQYFVIPEHFRTEESEPDSLGRLSVISKFMYWSGDCCVSDIKELSRVCSFMFISWYIFSLLIGKGPEFCHYEQFFFSLSKTKNDRWPQASNLSFQNLSLGPFVLAVGDYFPGKEMKQVML